MMTSDLATTPLHRWHAVQGAKLVDFAGWSMPIQYDSIVAEHMATRSVLGLFDVSHMGRFRFFGKGAAPLLEGLLTRRLSDMKPGKVRYSLMTNDQGGILDDVLVSRIPAVQDAQGDWERESYALVVNASNRPKIWSWIQDRLGSYDVELKDETCQTAMIAAQGPQAIAIGDQLFRKSAILPSQLGYYQCASVEWQGSRCLISRTGYTGEDGIECIVPAEIGLCHWEAWIEASPPGGMAAGLGARDTLRLEAGMPLYGHELNEQIDPFQAGLGFAVQLKDRAFPGHSALVAAQSRGPIRQRVGLAMEGKRVPREEYPILSQGRPIGKVSSGTFSPTLQRPIAMGYVEGNYAAVGTKVTVDLRGRDLEAHVTQLPFYQRNPS